MGSLFEKDDIQLMQNAELIERKNRLLKNLIELLSGQGEGLHQEYMSAFPQSPPPKVNRGENYKGFPYLVLDYPRAFSKEHVFAFRSLFWWGHFFSCTLHLKGEFLKDFSDRIPLLIEKSEKSELLIRYSLDGNEWNHDALSDEYADVANFLADQKMDFFKLTAVLPLQEIDKLHAFIGQSHKLFLKTLL